MSFSATVDYRYRLIAADLGGRPHTVMVTRVSYQGVENLQPMLHFEGMGKPLALDPTQRLTVSQIARSTAVSDWVGLMMELHPVEQDGRSWIDIIPVGGKRQKVQTPPPQPRAARPTPREAEPIRSPAQPRIAPPAQKATEPVRLTQPVPTEAETRPSARWFDTNDIPQTSIWTPILLAIVLILAFVAVFQLETNDAAWQWLAGALGS